MKPALNETGSTRWSCAQLIRLSWLPSREAIEIIPELSDWPAQGRRKERVAASRNLFGEKKRIFNLDF